MKTFVLALALALIAMFALPYAATAADGSALFTANKCVMCHKADGAGMNPKASLISAEAKAKTDAQLTAAITGGAPSAKPPMKAYTFSADELKALVCHIRDLQKAAK